MPAPILGPFGGDKFIVALDAVNSESGPTLGYHCRHGNLRAVAFPDEPTRERYYDSRARGESLWLDPKVLVSHCGKHFCPLKTSYRTAIARRVNAAVLLWDIETVFDHRGFAAANDDDGESDDEVRASKGDKFPK